MRTVVVVIGACATVALAVVALSAAPPQEAAPEPLSPFGEQRVEALLEQRLACRGCHVIDGRGGLIGPTLDGLDARADAAYVRQILRDPAGTVPGTLMPRQSVPERDLERLVAYLLTLPAPERGPATDVVPEAPAVLDGPDVEDGAALYARHCTSCHGAEGAGDGWNAPLLPVAPTSHADAGLMALRTDDALYDAIHAGAYVLDGSPRMPPFGSMLSPAQVRALVAHIRTLCACTQPAWAGG